MTSESTNLHRRSFMGAAVGAVAGAGLAAGGGTASAQAPAQATSGGKAPMPGMAPTASRLFRLEGDVSDCEVSGRIPTDLNGAFYRVGPDPQYPLYPLNIPFDGEGHVSMFRIKDGRVDFRSRYVRNDRYVAQEKARKLLFPMYRNPYLNLPEAKGLSRSTANTHIINHKGMLLALKEDSPPAALDLLTLETVHRSYTFDGQLESQTFTAHPKLDSETGDMIAFGYEAKGHGTKDVNVFQITPEGKMVWSAWIKVPYVGMLHDFAVTQNHIVFYVIPLAFDEEQMKNGGIHWSWYPGQPTYFGVMRRGGDGRDIKWLKGPERSATHVLGAFDDGDTVYVDVEMSLSNPFPFMPMRDGSKWDPVRGASHITRLSANLSDKSAKSYNIETLHPNHPGALPRQDDRYNTVPYRWGFLGTRNPETGNAAYIRMDQHTRKVDLWDAGPGVTLNEVCFAPKGKDAAEGEGYIMGVAFHQAEGGRADLVILDAQHVADGPVATVHMPTRIVGQIHGWWVREDQLPQT